MKNIDHLKEITDFKISLHSMGLSTLRTASLGYAHEHLSSEDYVAIQEWTLIHLLNQLKDKGYDVAEVSASELRGL